MYTNETVLTPLFRYIIWCIEKDGSDHFEQALSELKKFHNDNQVSKEATDNTMYLNEDRSTLDRTIRLLEMEAHEKDQMYSFWENECNLIESESCRRCVFCRKCRSYYWHEVGELLFQKTNAMKQLGCYLPIKRIPEKIERNLTPSKKAADLYYNNSCRNRRKIEDGCIILKGMSSSTPSLLNSIYDTNQYSGGGFYLRHNGIGVAIDPGYHFLDNLHHYGLSVLDINAVVITHEHIDHNNDMRLLDDLHHAVYRYEQDENKRKIHWYLDKVSYEVAKVYQSHKTGFDLNANELHCIIPQTGETSVSNGSTEEISICGDSNFRLKCFMTKHIENKEKKQNFSEHTFGCQFRLAEGTGSKCLVYTSDTKYFPELVDYIDMPDILIANISGVYEDDFMLVKQKERHLGYYGCYHLLNDIRKRFSRFPDLVMLSEFWNGENDIRYDVAAYLEKQFKREYGEIPLRIIPAEVGMIFHVTDGSIRCSQCGKFARHFLIRKPNRYEDKIRVLCNSCVY